MDIRDTIVIQHIWPAAEENVNVVVMKPPAAKTPALPVPAGVPQLRLRLGQGETRGLAPRARLYYNGPEKSRAVPAGYRRLLWA